MMRYAIALALCAAMTISHAMAAEDTAILLIENNAGMVTTNIGMTQRECHAAAALLGANQSSWLPSTGTTGIACPSCTTASGAWQFNGGGDLKVAASSALKSAKCVKPTEATK